MTVQGHTGRRAFLGAAALSVPGRAGLTQGLSGRPVSLVVPFSAGSGPDLLARLLADYCQKRWNQPFVVDNRIGASGNIGTGAVARAAPDGQTLLVTANTLAMNVSLFRTLPYDPVASFAPVAAVVDNSWAIIVPASGPQTLAELIAKAQAEPGRLTYSSPGIGTPHHLAMEVFKRRAGVDLLHIPYRQFAGAVSDVVGGQVSTMFISTYLGAEMAKGGRVRMLAMASEARQPIAPEVPTLIELGVTGVDVDAWWAILAPAGTPPAIVARYNTAVNEFLTDPEAARALFAQGLRPLGGPPERLRDQIAADIPRWASVVRDAGIVPE